MPWLPYWRFVIRTRLPPKEVLGRLSAEVEPARLLRCPWWTGLARDGATPR